MYAPVLDLVFVDPYAADLVQLTEIDAGYCEIDCEAAELVTLTEPDRWYAEIDPLAADENVA